MRPSALVVYFAVVVQATDFLGGQPGIGAEDREVGLKGGTGRDPSVALEVDQVTSVEANANLAERAPPKLEWSPWKATFVTTRRQSTKRCTATRNRTTSDIISPSTKYPTVKPTAVPTGQPTLQTTTATYSSATTSTNTVLTTVSTAFSTDVTPSSSTTSAITRITGSYATLSTTTSTSPGTAAPTLRSTASFSASSSILIRTTSTTLSTSSGVTSSSTTTSLATTTIVTSTTSTTSTTTTTSSASVCATESAVCAPSSTILPLCCNGLQCIQGFNSFFCRSACVPDGGPCSLNDPGACCGQVCLVNGVCATI